MGHQLTLPPSRLFIDGGWREASGDERDDVINPATEAVLATVGRATVADTDRALSAARRAFDQGPWGRFDGAERARHLRRFHSALAERAAAISALVVAEVGTTVAATRGHQVGLPIEHLAYWADLAERPELVPYPPRVTARSDGTSWLGGWVVRREPVGVVAAITAYNFPFLLNIMKLGPALAAGNTVVLKPSPYTPLSALVLAEAAAAADLPPGVLNVVTGGPDVGAALTTDPRVDLVSFTGSDAIGAAIMGQAAPSLKRLVLELGGKSPLVIRHDADLDLAAQLGVQSFTFHAGQGCALTTRHLVHQSLVTPYQEKVAAIVDRLRVGDPADPDTHVGPLIRPVAVERTERYVAEAVRAGATVVTGGRRPEELSKGFFYQPTLLGHVDNRWPVAQEEIFGPVAVVVAFEDDDHAVALANDSAYGLDGHVVSADAGAAFALACRLRTGGVSLNGGAGWTNPAVPFGGYKRSGFGRENGEAGLDEYTQLKTIKYHAT
ncbi:MAG TPA: aldehyde dehydrogenase family protein [Acidimicrobiales bacterium]|jgi:aldehyde dehydrogenase (NAD+)|nr:aldehyde dehydrogenase family protein [Acidimicrobiales bacterium]